MSDEKHISEVAESAAKVTCGFCRGSGKAIAVDSINASTGETVNPREALCMCCNGTGIAETIEIAAEPKHNGFPAHITKDGVGVWTGCHCVVCEARGHYEPEELQCKICHHVPHICEAVPVSHPSGKTFLGSDGTVYCDECCNGDRCDDPTHRDRKNCPYCLGSGKPVVTASQPVSAAPLAACDDSVDEPKRESAEPNRRNFIVVWKDGSWRMENELDATYTANDPDWLVTIPPAPLEAVPVSQPEGVSDANADISDYLCAGHAQIWYTERNLLTKGKCWLCDGDKSNLHPEGGCAHLSAREFVDKWGPWEAGDSTEVAEIAEAYAAHCSRSGPSAEDVANLVEAAFAVEKLQLDDVPIEVECAAQEALSAALAPWRKK